MNSTFVFLIVIFVLTGISLALIPFLTRKTENFGVSIPETLYHRTPFKKMRKQYALIMMMILLTLTFLFFIIKNNVNDNTLMTLYIAILFLYLILSFLVYLPFHFKMKKIKQKENWTEQYKVSIVIDTTFRKEKLTYSNWLYIIPFVIIILTIIYTFSVYDMIPNEVPRHISASGKITYSEKSPGILLMLPLIQLFMIGIFLIVNYVIKQSKQQVSTTQPEISKRQNVIFRKRWSLYTFITGTLVVLLFSFLQLTFIYEHLIKYIDPIMYTVIGLILVSTIILSINTGQGGSRIKVKVQSDQTEIDRDDDQHWKLGQFYFNKNDPAIFIEKRFGIGWSANFARPITWIFLGGIITLSLFPLIITLFF